MKFHHTYSFPFAAGIAFAAALIFSCSDEKDDGVDLSSSSIIAAGSSSSNGEAPLSSSIIASSSSFSSSSNAPSSSSIAVNSNLCGTTEYNSSDPNYRCENNVLEGKCGAAVYYWYDVANFRCENNVLEGKCGEGWYNAVNQRCGAGNVIETKCGEDWYNPADENFRCSFNIVESKCGEKWHDWHHSQIFECRDDHVEEKCGDGFYTPGLGEYCSNGTVRTYGTVADKEGNIYKTIVIGAQTWMAENLYYDPKDDSPTTYCPDNLLSKCKKYGRFYDLNALGVICPNGWHVPNIDEWSELFENIGGYLEAGKHLKSKEDWLSVATPTNPSAITGIHICGPVLGSPATIVHLCMDTYGFNAIPTGCYNASTGNYYKPESSTSNTGAYWWTTTVSGSAGYAVLKVRVSVSYEDVAIIAEGATGQSCSNIPVRCVKD
jgi:uncharacterized protein (TIGR02145 family)